MRTPGAPIWYRADDHFTAVVGPLTLRVVRRGVLWEGLVTPLGGGADELVLATSGRYRALEKAQGAAQGLAKEILALATTALSQLSPEATNVPRA